MHLLKRFFYCDIKTLKDTKFKITSVTLILTISLDNLDRIILQHFVLIWKIGLFLVKFSKILWGLWWNRGLLRKMILDLCLLTHSGYQLWNKGKTRNMNMIFCILIDMLRISYLNHPFIKKNIFLRTVTILVPVKGESFCFECKNQWNREK